MKQLFQFQFQFSFEKKKSRKKNVQKNWKNKEKINFKNNSYSNISTNQYMDNWFLFWKNDLFKNNLEEMAKRSMLFEIKKQDKKKKKI